jgi:peptide/nickel transport system permease protein
MWVGHYLLRRVTQGILVIYLLLTLLFFTARLTGDPVTFLVGGFVTADDLAKLRHAYGLDAPITTQYAKFMSHAVRLDFGRSIRTHEDALPLVMRKALVSLQLVGPAIFLALCIAIPLGALAALKRGGPIDAGILAMAVAGQSMPGFVLGMVLIYVFGVRLGWLPTFGQGGLDHRLLPVLTLMGAPLASYTRLVRAQVSETMTSDYVRTARSKGLSQTAIISHHVLQNALLPVVTILGVQLGLLLSGAVIVETIFAWPGFGATVLEAATTRDYPVLQAGGFLVGTTVTLSAIFIDLTYGFLDPRMRLRSG